MSEGSSRWSAVPRDFCMPDGSVRAAGLLRSCFSGVIFWFLSISLFCSMIFCFLSVRTRYAWEPPALIEASVLDGDVFLPAVSWEEYALVFRSRDLFAPVSAPTPISVQEGRSFRIKGIMIGSGNSVVLEEDGSRNIFLAEGEKEGDIHLQKVSRETVVLEIGQRTLVLETKGQI